MPDIPCLTDTDCIDLSADDLGRLVATLNCACRVRTAATAGVVPCGGGGWSIDLDTPTVGVPYTVAETVNGGGCDCYHLVNPSACLEMRYQQVIASREIEYAGDVCAGGPIFEVVTAANVDGAGYVTLFTMEMDMSEWTIGGPILYKSAGGAMTSAGVLAASATLETCVRVQITVTESCGGGNIVSSPGVASSWLGVSVI